jgi:hypothetical protein
MGMDHDEAGEGRCRTAKALAISESESQLDLDFVQSIPSSIYRNGHATSTFPVADAIQTTEGFPIGRSCPDS